MKADRENVTAYLYVSKHTAVNATNSSLTSVSKVVGTSWVRLVRSFTVTSSYPYVSIRVQNNGGSGVTMWFEAELDRLEAEGMLFYAEYESGRFRQVTRAEVVNPTPTQTETFYFNQEGK